MESKKIVWIFMTVGMAAGGFIPMLWGAGEISFSSIILSGIGGIIGIWFGFKLSR